MKSASLRLQSDGSTTSLRFAVVFCLTQETKRFWERSDVIGLGRLSPTSCAKADSFRWKELGTPPLGTPPPG
jgi:hypothetical protein